MARPPQGFYICPCCGTQFEYDDAAVTHEVLRQRWFANGAHWFSRSTPAPSGWNINRAYEQVFRAGLGYEQTAQGTPNKISFIDLGEGRRVIKTKSGTITIRGRVLGIGHGQRQVRFAHA